MRTLSSKALFSHWNAKRADRPAPDRRAVDPAALGASLPDIFLLERQRNGDIRFRLAGTRVCNIFGEELRGVMFDQLFDPSAIDDVRQILETVLDHGKAVISGVAALYPERISLDGELLLLPLTNETGADGSDRLIGALSIAAHRPQALPSCTALDLVTFRLIEPNEEVPTGGVRFPGPSRSAIDLASHRRARFIVHEGGMR